MVRRRSWHGHVGFASIVELADGIRFHLPGRERHGDLVRAFAEFLVVDATHERTFNAPVVS
jgi:hypothetical protein